MVADNVPRGPRPENDAPDPPIGGRPLEGHGMEERESFTGGPREMHYVGWSPDGHMLAVTGADGSAAVWRAESRHEPTRLTGHEKRVLGLAWHPTDGSLATASDDGTVRLWNVQTGEHEIACQLDGTAAKGVAWSPSGRQLAVTDSTGGVGIWDVARRKRLRYARRHDDSVRPPYWSRDGSILVTSSFDGVICVLSAEDLGVRRTIATPGEGNRLWSTALSRDGGCIGSGHRDATVRVWETQSGRELAVLEGHNGTVGCVAFSPGERLLASAAGSEIRLWRRSDWACVATLAREFGGKVGGLDFHPTDDVLAAKDNEHGVIRCWSLDAELLAGRAAGPASRRYVNAKVVLLGDTGVGKSGLGLVLSGQPYAPTDSTHGRKVWVFDPEGDDGARQGLAAREVLLWDLAGQPGYRMVHQLHLNEIAVALVVFDARSETDPFAGVKHWTRALAHARRIEGDAAVPARTFLVAARTDRGGVPVTQERLRALAADLGVDGIYETSAKEGWQIAELREAMLAAIDWQRLPTVSSNELLEEIRTFVLDAKREGRILVTAGDLFRGYAPSAAAAGSGDRDLRADFDACLGRVEGRGLIRRLAFGDYVLLAPELLDAYASALVQAAKEEPDGLAVISEEDALAARFRMAESERIASRAEEKLLLIATVAELLRHEVALKEPTDSGIDLVFPSQFTRERPDAPHIAGRALTFGFEGSLHNIYATLAVRLARSHLFARREMWRNGATYASAAGGVCGIYLRELDEGVGELDVFFESSTETAIRRQFETYVFEHLQQRAGPGTVSRRRVLTCPACDYALPDDLVRRRRERGDRFMPCPDCERQRIALTEEDDEAAPSAELSVMHRSAITRRDSDVATTRLHGKIQTGDFDVFLCHNGRDKAEVAAIGERLKARGIHPWLDVWEIPPGASWQDALAKQIKSVRSAAVFVGKRTGPWQDMETKALLQRFVKSKLPVIPVILESRKGNPRLPGFLPLLHRVDMRESDPDPFEQLVWGITGERSRF